MNAQRLILADSTNDYEVHISLFQLNRSQCHVSESVAFPCLTSNRNYFKPKSIHKLTPGTSIARACETRARHILRRNPLLFLKATSKWSGRWETSWCRPQAPWPPRSQRLVRTSRESPSSQVGTSGLFFSVSTYSPLVRVDIFHSGLKRASIPKAKSFAFECVQGSDQHGHGIVTGCGEPLPYAALLHLDAVELVPLLGPL